MARYTIELRKLIQAGFNPFDDSWTTFVPEHKQELCEKIVRHYNFYEIGSETPERFKFYLNEQLARIMPYYNQLYASELLKIEPIYNMVFQTTNDRKRNTGRESFTFSRSDMDTVRNIASSLQRKYEEGIASDAVRDASGKKVWDEHTVGDKDTDTSATEKHQTDTTQDSTETTDETGNEKMSDGITGSRNVHETTSQDGSLIRKYSDTPQAKVGTSSMQIEQRYLTNYTNESTNSDGTTDTTETTSSDETKNTDTTGKTDVVGKVVTDSDTDITKSEDQDTHYSEDKNGTETNTLNQTDKANSDKTGTEKKWDTAVESTGTGSTSGRNDESKEDEAEKTLYSYKGFTVSQADLLLKFRQTFINVDQMIIDELAENFMEVF